MTVEISVGTIDFGQIQGSEVMKIFYLAWRHGYVDDTC